MTRISYNLYEIIKDPNLLKYQDDEIAEVSEQIIRLIELHSIQLIVEAVMILNRNLR